MYTYKITKKNKNIDEMTIEKSGLSATFTIRNEASKLRDYGKQKKEFQTLIAVSKAKIFNIEREYPNVLKFTEEFRTVMAEYHKIKQALKYAEEDLKITNDNIKAYEKEIKLIKDALNITEETELERALEDVKSQKDEAGETLKAELAKLSENKKNE